MQKVFDYIAHAWFPILFIIGGILDQNTDLFVQFLAEINCPAWMGTTLRIIVISVGAFKIYYTIPKTKTT